MTSVKLSLTDINDFVSNNVGFLESLNTYTGFVVHAFPYN